MLPWNYGFHFGIASYIFLGAFYTVVVVVITTVVNALWRARRDLGKGKAEDIRWHSDFHDLSAAEVRRVRCELNPADWAYPGTLGVPPFDGTGGAPMGGASTFGSALASTFGSAFASATASPARLRALASGNASEALGASATGGAFPISAIGSVLGASKASNGSAGFAG